MCLVPDGDLFASISDGSATVVTDRIETFTEDGLRLESGAELEAEVVVTATGLNLLPIAGIDLAVDGERIELPETMGYKGMMLSGVPEHGHLARLHECFLDAEMRPHLPVRLPPAQPHGRPGVRVLHAGQQRSRR